jgi:accessory gene regulator protein AgrB
VFYSNRFIAAKQTIRTHETIHIYQQLECSLVGVLIVISGVFFFDQVWVFLPAAFLYYILYGIFYAVNLVKYKDGYDAYCNIPFEKEAWKKENQPEYIVFRKPFSWIKEL